MDFGSTFFLPTSRLEEGLNLERTFSHELTHAFDAHSNRMAGVNLVEHPHLGRYWSVVSYGNEKLLTPADLLATSKPLRESLILVQKLIQGDRKWLANLKKSLNARIQGRSMQERESKDVAAFLALVQIYEYERFIIFHTITDDLLDKHRDQIAKDYDLKKGTWTLKVGRPPIFLRHYSIAAIQTDRQAAGQVTTTVVQVDPRDTSREALALDLLLNIENYLNLVEKEYSEDRRPQEVAAFMAEIFAPFSMRRYGLATLQEWLLPKFTRYSMQRSPASYQTCLAAGEDEIG